MFSCEYCEIFNSTNFEEHLRTDAPKNIWKAQKKRLFIKVAILSDMEVLICTSVPKFYNKTENLKNTEAICFILEQSLYKPVSQRKK